MKKNRRLSIAHLEVRFLGVVSNGGVENSNISFLFSMNVKKSF